jgi:hypothetical protein
MQLFQEGDSRVHHVHDDPRAQGFGKVWLVGGTVEALAAEAVDQELTCLFIGISASAAEIENLAGTHAGEVADRREQCG